MTQIRVQIRERQRLLFLTLCGLLLSIWFMGRMEQSLQETAKTGGAGAVSQLAMILESQPNVSSGIKTLRGAVLWRRIGIPVLWIFSSFTAWGAVLLYLFWILLGFSAGALLWLLIGAVGFRGPFMFWALVFPQYLCYLPALLLLYIACLRWNQFWRGHRRHLPVAVWSPQMRFFVLRVFLGLLLYGLGIWSEIHMNPWILKESL